MEKRDRRKSKKDEPSLILPPPDYEESYEGEELEYDQVHRQIIEPVIDFDRVEELRVRGASESYDGTYSGDEEDRIEFIIDLYGGEEIDTTD